MEVTVTFLEIYKWEPAIYIGFSPVLHLQCTTTTTFPVKMESAYALPLPRSFLSGLEMSHVGEGKYGRHLNVYDWQERRILQRIDLGVEGTMPLEIR